MPHTRRSVLAFGAALAGGAMAPESRAQPSQGLRLRGRFTQGGWCVGRAAPGAPLFVDGKPYGRADARGLFYVGFDRDAPARTAIACAGRTQSLAIAPVTYDVQRVDGLPPDTVTPQGRELLDRIGREWLLKNRAFASLYDSDDFANGFIWPLRKFVVSGHFGNQRILNGVPKSPHMGFDMAAPTGTPIHAPQAGRVVLAQPDMFYEGGLTFIDHGQGVISMYLHQSAVLVAAGQRVRQGQLIGRVGDRGRATGPHLCWRLKWRDRHLDPSLMVL